MEIFIFTMLLIVPFWKICQRAGFRPMMAFIASIPVVGVTILSAILALKDWPLDGQSKDHQGEC